MGQGTLVVKCGGSAMDALPEGFFADLAALPRSGMAPVVVHGGGPAISALLARLGIAPAFVNGLRVTDEATLEVVEMVLAGTINKQLVRRIWRAGGRALGLSGSDGALLVAEPIPGPLGRVATVKRVNADLIRQVLALGYIPVIAPVGMDEAGQAYNINADTAAGAVARALAAERVVLVTDVPGIWVDDGGARRVLDVLDADEAEALIAQGVITGGMIPKVRAALDALDAAEEVRIVDGREPGVLQRVAAGEAVGTRIVRQTQAAPAGKGGKGRGAV